MATPLATRVENLKARKSGIDRHPLFTGETTVGLISGEAPRFPAEATGHDALGKDLQNMGLRAQPVDGYYGGPEKSWMVFGPSREQMYSLGKRYGQEAVVFSQAGQQELLHTNGPNAGRFHPAAGHDYFEHEPEDAWTKMPEGGYLRLNFDSDKLLPANLGPDVAVSVPQDRTVTKAEIRFAVAGALRKAIASYEGLQKAFEHPVAHPRHDGHTRHALRMHAPGVVLVSLGLRKDEPKPPEAPKPVNDQAAGVGVSTYSKYAAPWGTVKPGKPTNLFHYDYNGKNAAIDQLVKDHGYNVYYMGGKHGKPDLANRNFNTGHIAIWDPSAGSGGDFGQEAYTDAWRKIHELSHALTYPEVNKLYGEGKRIGKLGHHRALREALRSVHWEWLAAHKQRELGEQIGLHVPDETFHKELATVMHDAVHRAVTGKFTEPSQEGFTPHSHKVPLDVALNQVRESANNLGLTGMHDLLKKGETMSQEKTHDLKSVKQTLAKALKNKLAQFEAEMLEMRKRELAKAEQKPKATIDWRAELAKSFSWETDLKKTSGPITAGAEPMVKTEPCKKCSKVHELGKCDMAEVKPLGKEEKKAKEPVKAADGNKMAPKPLKKVALPGFKKQMAVHANMAGSKAALPPPVITPAPKMPTPDQHAARAAELASFTPPATAGHPMKPAPKLPGLKAPTIKAEMPAAPTPKPPAVPKPQATAKPAAAPKPPKV